MEVLVLTPYLYGTTPGPRSSIELWDHILRPADINFHYAPFENAALRRCIYQQGRSPAKIDQLTRAYVRRLRRMRSLHDYDAVLVYREAALIGPEIFERWVHRAKIPMIYQLDDPLYVPYRSPFNGYFSYLKCFSKVGRIARIAKLTIVNSRQHREYVARFTDRIKEIPILVDGDAYQVPRRQPCDRVTIGWSGSPSTARNLSLIAAPLAQMSRRGDVAIRLIGGTRYDLPGVAFIDVPWAPETEVRELQQLDVGLLPVPVTPWNKRKFFMKLVQYMAVGAVSVCTPIGANPEVIDHGANGILAASELEWRAALERLGTDAAWRAQLSVAAARTAHEHYTVQARAAEIVDAFDAALR